MQITGPPLNLPGGETVVEVLTLPPHEAAQYLEEEDPIHADVVRHAHALGLLDQPARLACPRRARPSGVTTDNPRQPSSHLGGADSELDQFLSDRLSEYNAAATDGVAPAQELTVRVLDDEGGTVGGISGWTWGDAGGMGMVWVHPDHRGSGVGSLLLRDFEAEARRRGCTHVFVTSFTFQAPGFYERHGYRELFRWDGIPTPDHADVHFRKDLRQDARGRNPSTAS